MTDNKQLQTDRCVPTTTLHNPNAKFLNKSNKPTKFLLTIEKFTYIICPEHSTQYFHITIQSMSLRSILYILILVLPISVSAQDEYTIPKKHRVIQETSTDSSTVQIDTKIKSVDFTTLNGATYRLDNLLKQGPVVFVFLSAECPVAQRYAMRLKRMHAEYKDQGITIVGVYSNENDSVEDVRSYLAKAEYTFPIVKDTDGGLARQLGATMTPQAHLIDTDAVLRYRGPIDDNRYVTRVKHEYLKNALRAVLDGKLVPVKETPAFGCTIHLPDIPTLAEINYSEHISPIMQKHCQSCHQTDGIAPFTLTGYEDVKLYADKIVEQIQAQLMPPWRTVSGHGDFKNERRLTDNEIQLIANWVKTGTTSGKIINDPETIQSPRTWALGQPDVVQKIPVVLKRLTVGKHASTTVSINTDFDEDLYIRAIDFQSDNWKSVRRIFADILSDAKLIGKNRTEQKDINKVVNTPDLRIGIWRPGIQPTFLPDKVGHLLPKGGTITLDLLYQGTDREEHDNLKIGLYLSDTPGTIRTYKTTLMNSVNTQGSSDNSDEQKKHFTHHFQEDAYVLAVKPIMVASEHELKVVAITPIGERIKMLWLKESQIYILDEWHDIYHYREPVFLPAGTRLDYEVVGESKSEQNLIVLHFYFAKASGFVK